MEVNFVCYFRLFSCFLCALAMLFQQRKWQRLLQILLLIIIIIIIFHERTSIAPWHNQGSSKHNKSTITNRPLICRDRYNPLQQVGCSVACFNDTWSFHWFVPSYCVVLSVRKFCVLPCFIKWLLGTIQKACDTTKGGEGPNRGVWLSIVTLCANSVTGDGVQNDQNHISLKSIKVKKWHTYWMAPYGTIGLYYLPFTALN